MNQNPYQSPVEGEPASAPDVEEFEVTYQVDMDDAAAAQWLFSKQALALVTRLVGVVMILGALAAMKIFLPEYAQWDWETIIVLGLTGILTLFAIMLLLYLSERYRLDYWLYRRNMQALAWLPSMKKMCGSFRLFVMRESLTEDREGVRTTFRMEGVHRISVYPDYLIAVVTSEPKWGVRFGCLIIVPRRTYASSMEFDAAVAFLEHHSGKRAEYLTTQVK